MIDEYETETIISPTRPQMVDLMEDGLDLLVEHCGCTYTVKTKSQGNYEAVIDAGGGMYFRVLMAPDGDNVEVGRESITFDWGYIEDGSFVSRGSSHYNNETQYPNGNYAYVMRINEGSAWIFAFHVGWFVSYWGWTDGYVCMRSVGIKSSMTGDIYASGRVYAVDNERQIWPDGDYVNLPDGPSRVAAVDNFDNAKYCIPTDKIMLYPSLVTFESKRHLGVPTIGDEPVYWMVRNSRITSWREFYVGGVKYVTLGHVSFKSLEREEET